MKTDQNLPEEEQLNQGIIDVLKLGLDIPRDSRFDRCKRRLAALVRAKVLTQRKGLYSLPEGW